MTLHPLVNCPLASVTAALCRYVRRAKESREESIEEGR